MTAAARHALPPIHDGLNDVMDRYDHFILDVWGVLHDGIDPYPGTLAALAGLQQKKKNVLLLSNSPERSVRMGKMKLEPMGIMPGTYNLFLTSGDASHFYMRDHFDGSRVYTFWPGEPASALEGLNVTRTEDIHDADFIYACLLPHNAAVLQYEDVMRVGLQRGLTLVCGNPDRVVGFGADLHLCVGSLAEWYEREGGKVAWIGKPYVSVYEQAWDMLGRPDKRRMLAIGDSLVTDVAGAVNFGCDVLWNVTGIHWEELRMDHAPDKIDPARVAAAMQGHAVPTGLLHGFKL